MFHFHWYFDERIVHCASFAIQTLFRKFQFNSSNKRKIKKRIIIALSVPVAYFCFIHTSEFLCVCLPFSVSANSIRMKWSEQLKSSLRLLLLLLSPAISLSLSSSSLWNKTCKRNGKQRMNLSTSFSSTFLTNEQAKQWRRWMYNMRFFCGTEMAKWEGKRERERTRGRKNQTQIKWTNFASGKFTDDKPNTKHNTKWNAEYDYFVIGRTKKNHLPLFSCTGNAYAQTISSLIFYLRNGYVAER